MLYFDSGPLDNYCNRIVCCSVLINVHSPSIQPPSHENLIQTMYVYCILYAFMLFFN